LPHFRPVLVAFLKGALTTWIRFTAEFEEDGSIHNLTSFEKEDAWMPPTNDVNERALGALRSHLCKKLNTTMLQYNAFAKFKFNDTSAFVKQQFLSDDYAFFCKMACEIDASHIDKLHKAEIIAFKDKQVTQRGEKQKQKADKQVEKEAFLASIDRVKNAEDVTIDMTVKAIDNQLEIYRKLVQWIPLKSHLKNKAAKIEALQDAIKRFDTQESSDEEDERFTES
jgi:hypothetical protein